MFANKQKIKNSRQVIFLLRYFTVSEHFDLNNSVKENMRGLSWSTEKDVFTFLRILIRNFHVIESLFRTDSHVIEIRQVSEKEKKEKTSPSLKMSRNISWCSTICIPSIDKRHPKKFNLSKIQKNRAAFGSGDVFRQCFDMHGLVELIAETCK